jgi:hypothetical protein
VKDAVYRPTLPQESRQWIIAVTTAIEEDLLEKVWQELDYRFDVCHVTLGAHLSVHISSRFKTLRVSLAIDTYHMIVGSLIIS